MHGFYRLALAVPRLTLADPLANAAEITRLLALADADDAALLLTPELALTGHSCADLFHQESLHAAVTEATTRLLAATRAYPAVTLVLGLPMRHQGRLYSVAAVMQDGRLHGLVPKSFLPNYREFYEKRWFTSGRDRRGEQATLAGQSAPFGVDLLFHAGPEVTLGVELCEDLWAVQPPSATLACAGATILLNLSASNELVGKADYRRDLVRQQSARCVAAYAYVSAGPGESSTDLVYGGHAMIAENGQLLAESAPLADLAVADPPGLLVAEVDVARLAAIRLSETSFADHPVPPTRAVTLPPWRAPSTCRRVFEPQPFVPGEVAARERRCREIFAIQAAGLARRLTHARAKCAVLGISGGLDSTLALLVCLEAMRRLGRPASDIVAVTMPGFGTSDRTLANARHLLAASGATPREVDLRPSCLQQFADLGHDPAQHDVTYENVQARQRTQLLMNLANKLGGLVVGTGDLSELALGWCTYNGDHMSMYAVNTGVPKTLVRYLVRWVAEHGEPALRATLLDVLETPVTPELLPHREGRISQMTEDLIGPYELHDFFLYHLQKYGAPPAKLQWLAERAFAGVYDPATIRRWLRLFLRRFFAMQFKRSCLPDGPKVGGIALSPRGDWRMPSDATVTAWLADLGDDEVAP